MKKYYIWLIKVFGYGNPVLTELMNRFGNAKEIYLAFKSNIAAAGAEYAKAAEKYSLENAERLTEQLENKNISVITYEDGLYPETLRKLAVPPVVLFAKGNIELLKNKLVSISGSRKITDYVIKAETSVCEELCKSYTLVSSLTEGCEQLACITASKCGKGCIEVMPCGLESEYPKGSRVLRQQLLMNGGCLISEFLPEVNSGNTAFLRRARILGGISKAMIIFQAGINSGSLNAAKYSPALFFLPPNDVFSPEYAGAVQGIRGGASLYLSEEDIAQAFSSNYVPRTVEIRKIKQEKKTSLPKIKKTEIKTTPSEEKTSEEPFETELHSDIYKLISGAESPLTFDEIFRNTDTDISGLNEILLDLEIEGKIRAVPGSRYAVV